MYEYEDNLFGYDMRHRQPPTIMPTEEEGWGGSRGRLAYSQLNRSQAWNYSEYAINTLGLMPQNYIIVNESEVNVNRETAFRVSKGRVAIPVKEFARQKRLTLKEQWELMNPRWVGTFFGFLGEDPYRSKRLTLERAIAESIEEDTFDEFMQQFWSATYGHEEAVKRLENRVKDLNERFDMLDAERSKLNKKKSKVQSDINQGNLMPYHLQGYNAHAVLQEITVRYNMVSRKCFELKTKADRIREYLKSITF